MNEEIKEILQKFVEICEKEALWDKVGQTYYNAKKLLRENGEDS